MQQIKSLKKLYRSYFYSNPIIAFWKMFILTMKAVIVSTDESLLFIERGIDARDNASVLFKYFRKKYPDLPAYYILDRNSSDWSSMEKYGNLIAYRSSQHEKLLLKASTYISSVKTDGFFIAPFQEAAILIRWLPFFTNKRHIFLQHGVIKDDMKELHKKTYRSCNLFICGAKPEYEYIKKTFGYDNKVVRYTGLARYDNLYGRSSKKREILLFPTWRSYNVVPSWRINRHLKREIFLKSEYFKHFEDLLNLKKLNQILLSYKFKLIFLPHPEIIRYVSLFSTGISEVVIENDNKRIQERIINAAMLITDYSSVAFDFGYMGKPVIYYQFDKEKFYEKHTKKGYYQYKKDGFGPVAEDKESLLECLENILRNKLIIEKKYMKNSERFFTIKDTCNCKRIAKLILSQ